MENKFAQLPPKKQQCIINAALEVFSKNEYKHASTEDIAAKAGISKGLLFYYFENKKSLYKYVYDYCCTMMAQQAHTDTLAGITDFFDLLTAGAEMKSRLLAQNPYLLDFSMRTFFLKDGDVGKIMQTEMQNGISTVYARYFQHVDFTKFRAGVAPAQLLQMLMWMTEGYLQEKQRLGTPVSATEIMQDISTWAAMFKQMTYKEEYL